MCKNKQIVERGAKETTKKETPNLPETSTVTYLCIPIGSTNVDSKRHHIIIPTTSIKKRHRGLIPYSITCPTHDQRAHIVAPREG